MKWWRWYVLAILLVGPVLFLVSAGVYYLWWSGWWSWTWWPLAGCLALAIFLAWQWQKQQRLLRSDIVVPLYWTERDRQAWNLVRTRAEAAVRFTPDQLSTLDFYVETGKELALDIARFYHPKSQDAVGSLTFYEMLAVVELAAHDLAIMVDQYLPGGHLLTLNDWRRARKATEWYQTASNLGWLVAGIFNPLGTGLRYLASQAGLGRPWQKLQQNLFVWAYAAFVYRLGSYLIDLHGGRLRVGAERYRQLLKSQQDMPGSEEAAADRVRQVTLVVLGQAKVGKSSLINALLGKQRAVTDVVKTTEELTRYELQPPGIPTSLVLTDTVGYGHRGPRADRLRTTLEAAQQADMIFLVLHALNPGRQADWDLLEDLSRYFQAQPDLTAPPILGVVTHMDLLSPTLEWAPPYDWAMPEGPKEHSIAEAMHAVKDQLGAKLTSVIPVCTAPGKVYGIEEALLPALAAHLDQAHAVAALRCLRAETDRGKIRKVFQQLLAAAATGLHMLSANHQAKDPFRKS